MITLHEEKHWEALNKWNRILANAIEAKDLDDVARIIGILGTNALIREVEYGWGGEGKRTVWLHIAADHFKHELDKLTTALETVAL